jgi:hypothetical protein
LCRCLTRKAKTPTLETFCEQEIAGAIPIHPFQIVAATIPEYEKAATQWVFSENALHHAYQAIDLPAHINRLPIRQDPPHLAM